MWPFSNLVYLRCVANWRNTYYKMLIQSLGTLPYFSQDLCQAVKLFILSRLLQTDMVILQMLQKYRHDQNSWG